MLVGKLWWGNVGVEEECLGNLLVLGCTCLHQSSAFAYTTALQYGSTPVLCNTALHQYSAPLLCLQPPPALPPLCCRDPTANQNSTLSTIALHFSCTGSYFLMQQMHSPKHCIKMQSELILGQSGFFPREQRVASFLRVLLAAAFWLPAKVQRPAGSSAVGKSVASQHSQDRLQSHSRKIRKFCHFFYFSLKLPSL